jgi:hypothetical protein
MPIVIFAVMIHKGLVADDVPRDARAVPVARYIHLDHEHGCALAVTRAQINAADIQPLATYSIGADLYIEGEPRENLDDNDDTGNARIWWRAVITGRMVRGGSA